MWIGKKINYVKWISNSDEVESKENESATDDKETTTDDLSSDKKRSPNVFLFNWSNYLEGALFEKCFDVNK